MTADLTASGVPPSSDASPRLWSAEPVLARLCELEPVRFPEGADAFTRTRSVNVLNWHALQMLRGHAPYALITGEEALRNAVRSLISAGSEHLESGVELRLTYRRACVSEAGLVEGFGELETLTFILAPWRPAT